jgi:pilus assembly protein CpaD
MTDRMNLENIFRAAVLGCVLIAGSCSVAPTEPGGIAEDGAANHPIAVEPSYREIKVGFAGGIQGMSPEDAAKFDAFLADYRAHGNGSIGISVPSGAPSRNAITYFGERAASSGIARDKILVSTHDTANGDFRVDVSYIAYNIRTDRCGDWSENLAYTLDNATPRSFGCSVQQNIAAMVADPRDLVQPRSFEPGDANRAVAIIGNYEAGKPTAAEKHTNDMNVEQSAPGSGVGN